MNTKIIKFLKTLNICFFLYLMYIFVGILNKGFDYADESFYILSSIYPYEKKYFFSYFHFITSFIYKISFGNILNSRILIFILLLFSSILYTHSLFKKKISSEFANKYYTHLIIIASSLSTFYYFINVFSPSYNILNLIFILNLLSILIYHRDNKTFSYAHIILISTFFFLILINKVTSGLIILVLIIFFFFNSKFFKKNFIVFSIFCFLYFLLLNFNENITYIYNLILNVLSNESDKFKFLNNHNLINLLEINLKDILIRLINYKFNYFYLFFFF